MIRPALVVAVVAMVLPAAEVKKPGEPALIAHAVGYQVYGCDAGGAWSKAEPVAALVTPAGEIIRHYRDTSPIAPTWEAKDGSKVHAMLTADGKPDQQVDSVTPNSIPQLGLKTNAGNGTGILGKINYVIRANTKNGAHPSGPCNLPAGSRLSVQYEADYFFFAPAAKY